MKRILCLDFDGVIFDSQKECLVTSYFAFVQPKNSVVDSYRIELIPKVIKDKFFKYRFLVRPAWHYGVLMDMLQNNIIINENSFDLSCKEYLKKEREFKSTFFKTRYDFMQKDYSYWVELNSPYPGVKESWERLNKFYEIYIVTNKNYESVIQLLKHYNLDINQKNIFSTEIGKSKLEILNTLYLKDGRGKENLFFVDDSSIYIEQMLNAGFLNSFHAKWGYENNIESKINIDRIINNFYQISSFQ